MKKERTPLDQANLPALSLAGSTRFPHYFGRLLLLAFIGLGVFTAFAPWRQFVGGTGRVIAFDPLERRVNVEAQVSGSVKRLLILEGQRVKKGETIAELQDNDPNLLDNIRAKRQATENKLEFAKNRLQALEARLAQQKLSKTQALTSAEQSLAEADINLETAVLNQERVANLYKKGLESRRKYEQAIQKRDASAAKYNSAQASLKKIEADFEATLASTQSSIESARSSIASAEGELVDLDSKLSENERQIVTAPRDGTVFQVQVTDGDYLKPGSLICVIIPETESRFVELSISGNDVALIKARTENEEGSVTPGSEVRLAFEGWPAIQSVGWPQTAIGTFGGEVVLVDVTDNGKGDFRVVVAPKEDIVDRGDGNGPVKVSWPNGDRWLRQGTLAKGWVLLDRVPLWYELWRQINGFPPIGKDVKIDIKEGKK